MLETPPAAAHRRCGRRWQWCRSSATSAAARSCCRPGSESEAPAAGLQGQVGRVRLRRGALDTTAADLCPSIPTMLHACHPHSPTTAALDWADKAVVLAPAPPIAWTAAVMRSGWANGPRLATYGSASVPVPSVMFSTTRSPSAVAGELVALYSCSKWSTRGAAA